MLPLLETLAKMASKGRKVRLPIADREIPLVCDSWAKPELGSGCVKITPAHDPNDYEVAKRCGLPMISIMNMDGTLNANVGVAASEFVGLTMSQGRELVVATMDTLGFLGRVEERRIELKHSDRSKTPIEPFLADQWFVAMDRLAQSAIDAVQDGRVKIYPERYATGYVDWPPRPSACRSGLRCDPWRCQNHRPCHGHHQSRHAARRQRLWQFWSSGVSRLRFDRVKSLSLTNLLWKRWR